MHFKMFYPTLPVPAFQTERHGHVIVKTVYGAMRSKSRHIKLLSWVIEKRLGLPSKIATHNGGYPSKKTGGSLSEKILKETVPLK